MQWSVAPTPFELLHHVLGCVRLALVHHAAVDDPTRREKPLELHEAHEVVVPEGRLRKEGLDLRVVRVAQLLLLCHLRELTLVGGKRLKLLLVMQELRDLVLVGGKQARRVLVDEDAAASAATGGPAISRGILQYMTSKAPTEARGKKSQKRVTITSVEPRSD